MNTIKYINKNTGRAVYIPVTQKIGGIGKKPTKAQADKIMHAQGYQRRA